jgi:Pyruvate/2-oxoacid:ferredoxin oxidoreductase delta subunit
MTVYQKLLVYYFSGTGNSENVAHWMADVAKEEGMEISLINIAKTNRRQIELPDPKALVAFVSPIHGFNYPPVMLNFLIHFPKGNNKVLLLNTRAGMLIGKWNVPGLTGIAFYFSALILKLKGYSIRSMFPVDLPSNWISVHPGLNERTVKFLHERNQKKMYRFTQKVLAGGSDFRGLFEIIQDLLISPISLGYFFIGRFFFAKTYYAASDCDNCGLCIKACPVKAIKTVDNRPFWTFNCESCMHCMSYCPKRAIETAHGSIVLITVLSSLFISGLFYHYFGQVFFDIEHTFAGFILESALFLGILAVWYRLIHYTMQWRFVERLVVYSSLTKYKFWGRRYRALKPSKTN